MEKHAGVSRCWLGQSTSLHNSLWQQQNFPSWPPVSKLKSLLPPVGRASAARTLTEHSWSTAGEVSGLCIIQYHCRQHRWLELLFSMFKKREKLSKWKTCRNSCRLHRIFPKHSIAARSRPPKYTYNSTRLAACLTDSELVIAKRRLDPLLQR